MNKLSTKEKGKIIATLCLGTVILFSVPAAGTYYILTKDSPTIPKIEVVKEVQYSDWKEDKQIRVFLADEPWAEDGIKYKFIDIINKDEEVYFLFEKKTSEGTIQVEIPLTRTDLPQNTETESYELKGYEANTGDLIYQKKVRNCEKTLYKTSRKKGIFL